MVKAWQGDKIFKCTWCGKNVWISAARRNRSNNYFCNQKCYGLWQQEHNEKGENHPAWKGGKIEVQCAWCGRLKRIYPNWTKQHANHFCNPIHHYLWHSENISGERTSNWQGGKSFEPYPTGWTRKRKRATRERDDHNCQICGITEEDNGRKLDVHHIDTNKKNLAPSNLISLCNSCHGSKAHGRHRKYWRGILKDRILGIQNLYLEIAR